MLDIKNTIARLTAEIAEFELIANLATDEGKRAVYRDLAQVQRGMIERLTATLRAMEANSEK